MEYTKYLVAMAKYRERGKAAAKDEVKYSLALSILDGLVSTRFAALRPSVQRTCNAQPPSTTQQAELRKRFDEAMKLRARLYGTDFSDQEVQAVIDMYESVVRKVTRAFAQPLCCGPC